MRGISAAVIGIIAVSLLQMVPKADPTHLPRCWGVLTIAALLWRPMGPLPLMLGGAVLGAMRLGAWGGR